MSKSKQFCPGFLFFHPVNFVPAWSDVFVEPVSFMLAGSPVFVHSVSCVLAGSPVAPLFPSAVNIYVSLHHTQGGSKYTGVGSTKIQGQYSMCSREGFDTYWNCVLLNLHLSLWHLGNITSTFFSHRSTFYWLRNQCPLLTFHVFKPFLQDMLKNLNAFKIWV